jgi:DHA1 family inner membrane transport protein
VAKVTLGLNLGIILGAPVGTAIGQGFGWRATFVTIVAFTVVALGLMLRFVPPGPRQRQGQSSMNCACSPAVTSNSRSP